MRYLTIILLGFLLVSSPLAQAQEVPVFEKLEQLLDRLAKTTEQKDAELLAEEVWARFFDSGSPSVDLILQRGIAAQAAGDLDLASDFFADVVEFAPEFAEGWNRRAGLEYARGEYALALEDLGMAIELQPRHFGALAGLGLVLERLGSSQGAYQAYSDALSIHPFLPQAQKGAERLRKTVEGRQL
jgi:tetratricopeptide (TPR) repeat protein